MQTGAATERIGQVIAGKYELRKVLGVGATSTVYEGWHRFTERRVAVKVLHDRMVGNDEAVGRFMREARASSAIGHPAIVAVLDAGVMDAGPPYMVQELLEGEDLETVAHARPLSWPEIIDWCGQLLDGLDAAHERGIVHRDIKPQNVFIVPTEGGHAQVKLVDFGVAKAIGGAHLLAITAPGSVIGTPYYMSPEQARGDGIDHRTDLWSVGVVIFNLATGRHPFDTDKGLGDLLMRIVSSKPPRVSELRADAPAQLVEAVQVALRKEPERRWPTAKAMAACLRRRAVPVAGLEWDD